MMSQTSFEGESRYMPPALERLFLTLSFAIISLVGFEALAVATAMPTVVESLNGMHMYALAMGAPLAAQMMTIALAGPWSDSLGPRSCLTVGIVLFSSGLLLAAVAPSMLLFVVGRAVQGLGGGLSIVPLYTIIGSSVQPAHQSKFFTAFAAAWILPALIGPTIAGFVVMRWSWRWIFGVVPVLMLVFLPLIMRVTTRVAPEPRPFDKEGLRRNLLPAVLAGFAVAVLQVTSGRSHDEFNAAAYVTILCSGIIALVAVRPLLPRGTFTSRRGLASTVLLRGTVNSTFIATEAYLPLMLKQVHGWSPFQAGLILLVGSLTWALGSWYQERIVGAKRERIPFIGAAVQLGGLVLCLPSAFASLSPAFLIVGWAIAGLGCGLAYPGLSVHALSLTSMDEKGRTSSSLQLADTFGGGFAIAMTGVVFAFLQPDASLPFFGAIGLMVIMQIGALVTATRIQPVPGSQEAKLLYNTYHLDDVSMDEE